jgi:hypothetical protein
MDRAAKLAGFAKEFLQFEQEVTRTHRVQPLGARDTTRGALAMAAEDLGFSPNEISAAVDQALTDAGTTP